ncbi:hypothetical protein HID58_037847, partial [Brassica napus]
MTTKKKRSGKEKAKEVATTVEEEVNDRIPTRLFAAVWFPSRRLNCYSSLEYLLLVRGVLEGSEEAERLKMLTVQPMMECGEEKEDGWEKFN